MKERPILFSTPMVRSLLNCTKSQTRRIVKSQPSIYVTSAGVINAPGRDYDGEWSWLSGDPKDCDTWEQVGDDFRCPYGQPGDRLWVREAWRSYPMAGNDGASAVIYRADEKHAHYGPWKPSIHMPRAASRILLEIVSVRVERLHEISEADAIAEGCPSGSYGAYYPQDNFARLWISINGQDAWDKNPWVWVVEFRRLP